MPAKNIIKQYVKGGFYHLYNRGVDKRKIFKDEKDYVVFLHYLKAYLGKPIEREQEPGQRLRPLKNIQGDVDLLSFCLMPNHFHLLVRQNVDDGIEKLMRRVATNYSMYFNNRHGRIGRLFEGTYKAVLTDSEQQLLYLSCYIHLNPTQLGIEPGDYPYSSFSYYLGKKSADWLNTAELLAYFAEFKNVLRGRDYARFVEDYRGGFAFLKGLLVDRDE